MRQCDLVPPLRGALQNSQSSSQAEKLADQRKYERSTIHSSWTVPWLVKLVTFWKAL